MKNIVIIGGGFGGVAAARGLAKKFSARGGSAFGGKNTNDIAITLIDKRDYQLFNSNLYEVATAEEELVSESQLKKSVTLPLAEIFSGTRVTVLKSEVLQIDRAQRTVSLPGKKISYDYLILALGSQSEYFNIEGAEKFSLPMKSLADALRAKNQIEFAVQSRRQDINKPNLRVIIAGGGYTGCELAGELAHEMELIAWKNGYPPEKIEILVVEAASELISGFSKSMSRDALWRLKQLGVRVMLASIIFKVDRNFVELQTQERIEFDVLLWTTGVKARPVPFTAPAGVDKKGRIITNQILQCAEDDRVFAIGDLAAVLNADGKPAPSSAQDAVAQGRYLAYALPEILNNRRPQAYRGQKHGFIVAMGGKWAIMDYGGIYLTGFLAYIVRQLANLRYYASVVSWWRAVKYIVFDWEVYGRND